jgi:predicted metal-dependent hydrolase
MQVQIYRRRGSKRISLRVTAGKVKVTAPKWVPKFAISEFLVHQHDWIQAQLAVNPHLPQAQSDFQNVKPLVLGLVTSRLAHFNAFYHFSYQKVTIRNQSSRWGSCSHQQTLSFNYRLYFLPTHLQDYIVVHELCHLGQMNHGPKFWALVAKTMPDHQLLRRHLRTIKPHELTAN